MASLRPADLDGRSVVVEMPASSANLGAGYDCLGITIAMTNRVHVEARFGSGQGPRIDLTVDGEGRGELTPDRDNRFVRGLEAAIWACFGELPEELGWRIEMENGIPLARGLGSSAAATVGGLLAGNALSGGTSTQAELLQLATAIEGHPDNAAAVFLGGLVASATGPDGVDAVRFDVPATLRAVLFIPDLRLSTADMRAALPATVPFADAVANVSAVAVGIGGLAAGRWDLLGRLTVDRLHEPYRASAYPQLPDLVAAARRAGALGACLSGAGSTIIAFTDTAVETETIERALSASAAVGGLPGRALTVDLRNTGARVLESQ